MVLGKCGNFGILGGSAAVRGCGDPLGGSPMLLPYCQPEFSAEDRNLFDQLVPFDHWTRRAESHIDFAELRTTLEPLFSKDAGRPAIEPVLFMKLELLMFHDCLSDTQVFKRAQTDLAYRRFLGLGRGDHLPDVSTLGRFRARLGSEGHKDVFHGLLKQARRKGLVKDRLRLKDATHVYANIAIPAGLQLVAQARNKLLNAAQPFNSELVAGERIHIETIRESSDGGDNEARLVARVAHLRDIVGWIEKLEPPVDAEHNSAWQSLLSALEIARKVLIGQDDPNAPRKIRSAVDPDARRGKHGEYYDGYIVDVLVDADSELFTAINVLAAGSSESADALVLMEQERSAHGNSAENLSIDGAGYDGPVIRELESPEGANTKVFVPPKETQHGGKFTPDQFELSEDSSHVTCPAGNKSRYKQREESRHKTSYRFDLDMCQSCPLKRDCIDGQQKHGRTVTKNDYDAEYKTVRERAQTEEYAAVKREHPRVERRLGELMNRHDGREARYRGLERNFVQQIVVATTANVKRMIRLLDPQFAFGRS